MGFSPSTKVQKPEAKSWWESLVQNITQTALTAGTQGLVGGLVKSIFPGADVAANVAGSVAGQAVNSATTPAPPQNTTRMAGRNFASDGIYQSGQMYPYSVANVPVPPEQAPPRFQMASVNQAMDPLSTTLRSLPSVTQRQPTASAASIPANQMPQGTQNPRNPNETYEEWLRRTFGMYTGPVA